MTLLDHMYSNVRTESTANEDIKNIVNGGNANERK